MAVAAYASLVSLTHVLDNLHYRTQFHLPRVDIHPLERLQENFRFLLEFVELHSENKSPGIGGLWRQISEVAYEAEDRIDFHVVNLLHKRSQGETGADSDLSALCEVMKIMISKSGDIKRELLSIKEEKDVQAEKQPAFLVPGVGSSTTSLSGKDVVVGLEDHVVRVMDVLTGDQSNLKILPIVGMGGIGKTTLAKHVFDDPYVVNYFDMRIWLTISQEYSVEQILMGLVNEGVVKGTCESILVDVGKKLYQKLFGRRYLVVMDDVWTSKAWDDLRKFFPNDGTGSRIMFTTRLSDVADCVGSYNPYPLSFLDADTSWELFCLHTFSQKGCPYAELERIGKVIARSCRGLPLEIVVIGRLLANSSMTPEYWGSVAENICSFGNLGDNEQSFERLYFSYRSLPIHLKPCFLYMRVFREDETICVSELVSLWVAKGFIKAKVDRSLEEIGEEYLKGLVARNLLFVKEWTIGREMKYCGMHDLLRDLCIRESDKEKFICSPKVQTSFYRKAVQCFFCSNFATEASTELVPAISPSAFQINPLVCDSCEMMYSRPRLLMAVCGGITFSRQVARPTTLHYFGSRYYVIKFVSPSMIHLLWNLHAISILGWFPPLDLPSEIWEMPQLRMLQVSGATLPDLAIAHTEGKEFVRLINLHTLSSIHNFNCTEEVVASIPNLKTLSIEYDDTNTVGAMASAKYSLRNLVKLNKLERLQLDNAWKRIAFPNSLKKLRMVGCKIPWIKMTIIGSLTNLEELELDGATKGTEWDPVEGEFLRLKGLYILTTDLVHWRADQDHFPKLEWLRLSHAGSLQAIPLGIGDITTLHTIDIIRCSDSVVSSARLIWEEQQSMGNETLQIHVTDTYGRKCKFGAVDEFNSSGKSQCCWFESIDEELEEDEDNESEENEDEKLLICEEIISEGTFFTFLYLVSIFFFFIGSFIFFYFGEKDEVAVGIRNDRLIFDEIEEEAEEDEEDEDNDDMSSTGSTLLGRIGGDLKWWRLWLLGQNIQEWEARRW